MPPSGGSGCRSLGVRAALGALVLAPLTADACPCGPGAAPVSTVSVPGERFAARASITGLLKTAT